jgi:MoxR-like ATPase
MRLGAEAMNAALAEFQSLEYSTQLASAYEAFLTAKWIAAHDGGEPPSFSSVGRAVPAIFGLLPEHPLGRLAPFKYDWRTLADTGRKTVWNNNSRAGTRMSQTLFIDGDLRHGIKPEAAGLLGALLPAQRRPSWESLAVMVLRDHDFGDGADWPDAELLLRAQLAVSQGELAAIASSDPLGIPLLSEPEWSFETMHETMRPEEAVVVQTSVTSPVTGATAPDEAALSVIVDSRVERMLRLALTAYSSVLLVGPPGAGKGTLLRWALSEIASGSARYGLSAGFAPNPIWRTPDESWTSFELIGGLAPSDDGNLTWSPGTLLNAIEEDRWLILDETNRADMDKIMGPLLTWLSKQEVEIGRSAAHDGQPIRIGWTQEAASSVEEIENGGGKRYLAGRDWRLLGTYNPQDAQRVFRFGQALSRRFVIVPVPAVKPGQFSQLLETAYPELTVPAAAAISGLYAAHLADGATALGPALFLGVARYVIACMDAASIATDRSASAPVAVPGAASEGEPNGTDITALADDPRSSLSELLAEAYVLGAGRYLAGYDDRAFDALGERIVNDEAALAMGQWTWVRTQRDILS